jgi:hypothetical protein
MIDLIQNRWFQGLAIILVITLLPHIGVRHSSYRYRLTVEIEAEGQVKTGSSVFEIRAIDLRDAIFTLSHGKVYRVKGEAVHIPLGKGRDVFVSTSSIPSAVLERGRESFQYSLDSLAWSAFEGSGIDVGQPNWFEQAQRAVVTDDMILEFLKFDDLNRPETAELVSKQYFQSVFGEDVVYRRAWIEITKDPVTIGIEAQLPWLSALLEKERKDGVANRTGVFKLHGMYLKRDDR